MGRRGAEDGGWRAGGASAETLLGTEREGWGDPDPGREVQTHREMGRKQRWSV